MAMAKVNVCCKWQVANSSSKHMLRLMDIATTINTLMWFSKDQTTGRKKNTNKLV